MDGRHEEETAPEASITGVSWSQYFTHVSSFLADCERQYGICNRNYCEYAIERLSIIFYGLEGIVSVLEGHPTPVMDEMRQCLKELQEVVQHILGMFLEYNEILDNSVIRGSVLVQRYMTGRPGRPSFSIDKEQLDYLHSLSFSWSSISKLLMISRSTLYRRRQYYGLNHSYTPISDEELNSLVRRIITQHPYVGQSFVWGVIRSEGHRVTRERVRQAMRRNDPVGTALRWGGMITPRKPYSVPGPNSLWHIDGNHKLIRWRLVCHGAIDGFTRMIIYLRCNNNNRSSTVLQLFLKGVDRFGLPSRVRSDYGGENYAVAMHMIRHRGSGRGSMLTGSSTHNQRIERLWVDMYRSVSAVYYRLFYYMEDQNLLDVLNEVHLFALHYVFMPRINASLESFQNGWNHHGIRTVGHKSPQQLFFEGFVRLRGLGQVSLDFFSIVNEDYGISYDDPTPQHESENLHVTVPESRITIPMQVLQNLQNHVNPLQESDDYGIELYLSTIEFLRTNGFS